MRKGEEWGTPIGDGDGRSTISVEGGDAALAAAAAAHPDAWLRFRPHPDSDFARALGLGPHPDGDVVRSCDALRLDDGTLAVNAVVLGVPPGRLGPWRRGVPVEVVVDGRPLTAEGRSRATTVVIANGQYVRGADLVPRGHPGDGRVEVQVYGLRAGERRAMRRRLATGTHVPHPRIAERSGRTITVRWTGAAGARRGAPIEVDGRSRGRARTLTISVIPGAVRVLG